VTGEAISKHTLGNGVRLVTEPMPDAMSVSIGFWAGVGSRDEARPIAGASHFLEHLLFKGTETRSARAIAEAVDAVGGEMNAYTSKEHTAYYLRLPRDELDFGMELMVDVLSAPAFRPAEIDAEREVILEEILMSRDAPDDRVHTILFEALYPDHALGREVLGEAETVAAMTREPIFEFFQGNYTPSNLVVAVAGRIDEEVVLDRVERYLEDVEPGTRPQRTSPPAIEPGLTIETRDCEQAHLLLGWHAVDYHDPDRYAFAVANQILGGGTASRLFQEVREERGLVYSVFSAPQSFTDSGVMTVYAGTAPSKVEEVLSLMSGIVSQLVQDGPTERELEIAKGFLEGSLVLGLEESSSRMMRLGSSETIRGEVISLPEQVGRIRSVDRADVERVLRRVFAVRPVLAVVGPYDEAEPVFDPYR
jgi:predicted Zn-dependent peptidase